MEKVFKAKADDIIDGLSTRDRTAKVWPLLQKQIEVGDNGDDCEVNGFAKVRISNVVEGCASV